MPPPLEPEPDPAVWPIPVGGLAADLSTVDLLARLEVTARRLGAQVQLLGVSPELAGLIELVGLTDVLGLGSDRRPVGQAEQREEPRRVEERLEGDDLAV